MPIMKGILLSIATILIPAALAHGQSANPQVSGRLGDILVTVTNLVELPASKTFPDRFRFEALVSVTNMGNSPVCANLMDNTVHTTGPPDLWFGDTGPAVQAPMLHEMLASETANGAYSYEIPKGVRPLAIAFVVAGSIRCDSSPQGEAPITLHQLDLDISSLPILTAAQVLSQERLQILDRPFPYDVDDRTEGPLSVLQEFLRINGLSGGIVLVSDSCGDVPPMRWWAKQGSPFRQVLDDFQAANPDYHWELRGDVLNIVPAAGIPPLLAAKVRSFDLQATDGSTNP